MTTQYLRNFSLVVANPAGAGLELGALRCVFEVRRGDIMTPNSCDARIYNLSDATANRVYSPEFTQLALQVGYGSGPLQTIFRGSIKQVRKGREDQKNSYVAVTAADGDGAYNFAPVALTLAAGSTAEMGLLALIQSMARRAISSPTSSTGGQAVTQGYVPPLSPNKSLRGRTYYGESAAELRQLARHNNCTASIQDGQVQLVPVTGYIPGTAVLITPFTGLIGVPEQTQNGLEMTVLMNPNIKIGHTVKLDSSTVNQYRYGLDIASQAINAQIAASTAKLNADGLYYVMRAEHNGDTRGVAWYTKLTCLAIDATVPLNQVANGAIQDSDAVARF